MFLLALLLVAASPVQDNARVQLIRVGSFHGSEVNIRPGENWWGLFPANSGFELRSVRVHVEPVRDMADEGTDKRTGKEVSVREGAPLVLVRGIEGMKPGPVPTVIANPRFFYPGERVSLALSRENGFSLTAYGNADRPPDSQPGSTRIYAYKLVLSAQPWFESNQQEIINTFYMDEGSPPRVVWAGDLDRDGRLDLLVDQGRENVSDIALFLSSAAPKGKLVELVARITHVGC